MDLEIEREFQPYLKDLEKFRVRRLEVSNGGILMHAGHVLNKFGFELVMGIRMDC